MRADALPAPGGDVSDPDRSMVVHLGAGARIGPDLADLANLDQSRPDRERSPWWGLCVLAGALACGGTAHQISIDPPPLKATHAQLAGGLCQDDHCTCR